MIDTDKWVTIDTYAFLKGIKRRWVYGLIKKKVRCKHSNYGENN